MPQSSTNTKNWVRQLGSSIGEFFTPTLRLGVTGLSRSGKTVFVTACIHNLTEGGRLPFFGPLAENRVLSCHLEPQPDDHLPRFPFERHRAQLTGSPSAWPESTRRISQLRLVFTYQSNNPIYRALGPRKLNLDIIDYPGEWLIDLSMLQQSYAEWSAEAIDVSRDKRHREPASDWLDFVRDIDPYRDADEDLARHGAKLFKAYLAAARTIPNALPTLGPGRFLMPGDLDDSPLLTFFPLDLRGLATSPRGSLAAMMARRYESYREHVVRPFFQNHFRELDRQIVLVDVLTALNAGSDAVADLQVALGQVLETFRPGSSSFLQRLLGRRIDKVLFAATKADHLPHASYDRLEKILDLILSRAHSRASEEGAEVSVAALSALRATREGSIDRDGDTIPCIVGVPLKGEQLGPKTFDGKEEAAVFPGDLPADPHMAVSGKTPGRATQNEAIFVRFAPPALAKGESASAQKSWPHIRLDRALDFLIGDWLA